MGLFFLFLVGGYLFLEVSMIMVLVCTFCGMVIGRGKCILVGVVFIYCIVLSIGCKIIYYVVLFRFKTSVSCNSV